MNILFDSKRSDFKTPFGCLKCGELCTLRILVPQDCRAHTVLLHLEGEDGFLLRVPLDRREEEGLYHRFSGSFSLFRTGLYFYWFEIIQEDHSFRLFRHNETETNMEEGEKWQLTCYEPTHISPSYYGAVMYQIFPDRFFRSGECDLSDKLTPFSVHRDPSETPVFQPDEQGIVQNNDFFGGNLRGITEKLDYLKQFGVSVLYLNPIFKAYSNHRYDTADYKKIDPMLGDEEDFCRLCREAHQRGIRVILDGVFSHTGADSVYFDIHDRFGHGAFHHPDSPYRNWYRFEGEEKRYQSWWGIKTLPCVEETDPDYQEFIITGTDSVISYWMDRGADGFRLDVADELPDSFIELLQRRVKEKNPNGIVIGEVWEDASNKCSYGVRRTYFTHAELDSVMNYPFRTAILDFLTRRIDAQALASAVLTVCENYPEPVVHCLMNSLSTHDTPRILTLLGDDFMGSKEEKAVRRLSEAQKNTALEKVRQAAALQFFLPGCPCIYYGDEAEMEGFEDPLNRRCFPWGEENTPLSFLYRRLGALKTGSAALREGSTEVVSCSDDAVHLRRRKGDEVIDLAVNRGGEPYPICGELLETQNMTGQSVGQNGFALYRPESI